MINVLGAENGKMRLMYCVCNALDSEVFPTLFTSSKTNSTIFIHGTLHIAHGVVHGDVRDTHGAGSITQSVVLVSVPVALPVCYVGPKPEAANVGLTVKHVS